MPTHAIPVVALAGFLGSGKTTLMNHLLEHSHGLKIGVVVNDYGDINIDSQFVSNQTDRAMELTNGCICCSMDTMELDEAIEQFAYPGSPIDYIVIEASGLAEPGDLAQTLRGAMTPRTRLDSIVAVLDAANWNHSPETRNAVTQQIEHGDFVVVNKSDLVRPTVISQLKNLITEINNRARIFTATNAIIDSRLLLGHPLNMHGDTEGTGQDQGHSHHQHLHERYASVSFAESRPLDPAAFQEFVNHQIPREVYRAKGIVNLGTKGHGRKYRFQLVGKRAELTWTDWGTEPPRTELVFIGQDFNATALRRLVTACIDSQPHTLDPAKRVALPHDHS